MSESLPFIIHGVTVPGKRLGSELGFPTANLAYPPGASLPIDGVYIAEAQISGRRYVAILNQGRHPTAPEGRATIESHLLDYPGGDLYGQTLTLCYLHYLRGEQRFPTLEALKAQMASDERDALAWVRLYRPDLLAASGAAQP